MPDKAFLDTNILIYAFSDGDRRQNKALDLLLRGGLIGVQTLNEFVRVQIGKLRIPWAEVLPRLEAIRQLCPEAIPVTLEVYQRGIRIAQATGYRIYDSLMLAAAIEAQCTVFCSEDLNEGQIIDGLRITNPFRAS